MNNSGKKKTILVSVTSDLVTDQRVHKVCTTLQRMDFDILLVGRSLPDSLELRPRNYACKRMKLFFHRSVFFYAEYNLRLFFTLWRQRPDCVLSNDLDTLLPNFLYARLFNKRIYYDSHEYFTEVPELVNRNLVRSFWLGLEKAILPRLTHTYTVSSEVASAYRNKYGIDMKVVRNFPLLKKDVQLKEPQQSKNFIIIYQGVLNIDRGLEEAILAMKYLENAVLHIVGGGDIEKDLRQLVKSQGLDEKVIFLGKVPFERLPTITSKANLGLSIEKSVGLNYQMALPNKLFDYIHAEIPVLVSPLIEVKKILDEFKVGLILDNHSPEHIAEKIQKIAADVNGMKDMKVQLKLAKEHYCWEKEEEVLRKIFVS